SFKETAAVASATLRARDHLRVVDVGTRSFRCKGVLLAGQDGERGCDLGQPGADVGAGRAHGACALAGVLVAGVRLRDGETEAALDPRQDGVAYPVRRD